MKKVDNALLLSFEAPVVIKSIQREIGGSEDAARELFLKVKLFLRDAANVSEPIRPTSMVDKGWHCFVLSTLDYAKFCSEVLGVFVHHTPKFDTVDQDCDASTEVIADCSTTKEEIPGINALSYGLSDCYAQGEA